MKKTLPAILAITILINSSHASVLDQAAIGGAMGGLSALGGLGALTLPPIFGDTAVSLSCNPAGESLNLPSLDLCSVMNKIPNTNYAFKIGPCDVKGANPLACNVRSLKDYCSNRAEKPVRTIASEVRNGERNLADSSRSKLTITGGDQLNKNSLCQPPEETMRKFKEKITSEKIAQKVSGTPAYGAIINTRHYNDSAQCIELALNSGKSQVDATKGCTPFAIGSATSQATASSIEIASIKTATETLKNPLNKAASGSNEDESKLHNMIHDKCSKFSSETEIKKCSEMVVSDDYGMKKKIQTITMDIEEKEAARMGLFTEATTHRKTVTSPTADHLATIPIQQRSAYSGLAKKSMAQDSLVASYGKRISDTKKEIALLLMQKTELMSKPFFEKAEAQKIKKELEKANAL